MQISFAPARTRPLGRVCTRPARRPRSGARATVRTVRARRRRLGARARRRACEPGRRRGHARRRPLRRTEPVARRPPRFVGRDTRRTRRRVDARDRRRSRARPGRHAGRRVAPAARFGAAAPSSSRPRRSGVAAPSSRASSLVRPSSGARSRCARRRSTNGTPRSRHASPSSKQRSRRFPTPRWRPGPIWHAPSRCGTTRGRAEASTNGCGRRRRRCGGTSRCGVPRSRNGAPSSAHVSPRSRRGSRPGPTRRQRPGPRRGRLEHRRGAIAELADAAPRTRHRDRSARRAAPDAPA